MTDRGDQAEAAGGPARHVPVMLNEVLAALRPSPGSVIVDGTFGAGGYSAALLQAGASVIAIDRDPTAIAAGGRFVEAHAGRLMLCEGRFGELDAIARQAGHGQADGVVLDIGVSSMQIDEAGRGFSFRQDGPLDMRMEGRGASAADVVNRAQQKDLTRIIGILGEERRAAQIAGAIARRRDAQPFHRTLDLAGLVEGVLGRKPGDRIHPATRTFQALRMFVNRELQELASALCAAERLLRAGGRLAVVTFHSLEDRLVKRFFAERAEEQGGSRHLPATTARDLSFAYEKRGAIAPTQAEVDANPRARSAKLRYAVRTAAAAIGQGAEHTLLPRLPDPALFATGGAHAQDR
jgi:16S rRNA (cytosine1402-N4)-methyltransferase